TREIAARLDRPGLLEAAHAHAHGRVAHAQDPALDRGRGLDQPEAEERKVGLRLTAPGVAGVGLGAALPQEPAGASRARDELAEIGARTEEVREEHRARARRGAPLELTAGRPERRGIER